MKTAENNFRLKNSISEYNYFDRNDFVCIINRGHKTDRIQMDYIKQLFEISIWFWLNFGKMSLSTMDTYSIHPIVLGTEHAKP